MRENRKAQEARLRYRLVKTLVQLSSRFRPSLMLKAQAVVKVGEVPITCLLLRHQPTEDKTE